MGERTSEEDLQERYRKRHAEEEEKTAKKETHEAQVRKLKTRYANRVDAWVTRSGKVLGKPGNICKLLRTLENLFTYAKKSYAVNESAERDSTRFKDVKTMYMKAAKLLHPDRNVESKVGLSQHVLAAMMFPALTDAFERYKKVFG